MAGTRPQKRTASRKTVISLMAMAVLFSFCAPVFADTYDNQISSVQAEINAQNAQINNLRAQADTLDNKLGVINGQIRVTQQAINLTSTKYDHTLEAITAAEAEMVTKKAVLGENMRVIYREGQVTPIELLVGSDSFSEYFDKQEYLQTAKAKVQTSIETIAALKVQLEKDKADLTVLLTQQKSLRDSLRAQQNEVSDLLDQTQGEEASYQSLVQTNKAKITSLQAAQRASIQKFVGRSSGAAGSFQYKNFTGNQGACGGGYGFDPAWGVNYCRYGWDDIADRWGLYNRECVSYTAWSMAVKRGASVPHFGGRGNANQWPYTLSGRYRMDADPSGRAVVAIVGSDQIGGVGHAMVVEKVYGNGWIHVSQYNWLFSGEYSEMDVAVSGITFIHFD